MKHDEPAVFTFGKGQEPFRVPEGYFSGVTDRVLERIRLEENGPAKGRVIPWKPVLSWVSGVAAILIVGMVGLRAFYLVPLQESRVQQDIEVFVEYCGEELQEAQLAGYMEQNGIELQVSPASGMDEIIEMEPESVEEFIYETIGF